MSDEQRSAVASYFSVYKGHEADRVKLAMGGSAVLHPALEAAAGMLQETWEEVVCVYLCVSAAQAALCMPDEQLPGTVQGAAAAAAAAAAAFLLCFNFPPACRALKSKAPQNIMHMRCLAGDPA
eukprot:949359-Pelagomonas_calceolata.AAC.6